MREHTADVLTNLAYIVVGLVQFSIGYNLYGLALCFLGLTSMIAHAYRTNRLWALDQFSIMLVFISVLATEVGVFWVVLSISISLFYFIMAVIDNDTYNDLGFAIIGWLGLFAVGFAGFPMYSVILFVIALLIKYFDRNEEWHWMWHILSATAFLFMYLK